MILPIVAYGTPVLRKKGEAIDKDFPDLDKLIKNMFETMENANGVGLAAPQIGKAIRLFVIDSKPMIDDDSDEKGLREVFINAEKVEETGDEFKYTEGCLSIPKITEDVSRKDTLTLRYFDKNWKEHTKTFTGMTARVIQHEYDHIDGVLFTDYLSPLKRKLLKGRLQKISKGEIDVDYRMKFPKK